ncbi:amino acid ABC transporter substrate-binding protein [Lentilactobacillus fungorum]|jgi:polar amino acid transport system substrate-binding protein|uniref:Amino acid ABC transporter substrate-binding protein n=1 Tax=Lentilactobacillus fungorum TaxID=2201250 RepID=A0ABQ3W3Y8_9LACO|nr:transporter substrate-binding domain-containing protein [Lentilactobacillus fungorum]GHP14749.1 amino acid ABC transporter substrate-binding protein [Lentilactobacillus fungorum]
MKLTLKKIAVVTGLLAITTLVLTGCGKQSKSSAANKTTITAVTDGNVAPFAVKEKSGGLSGYDVDVLKAAVKHLPQYKLQWKLVDYEALLGNIDSGRADVGVNHLGKTAERQEKYLFSKPIFEDKPVFIVKKTNKTIKSFATAAGKTTPAQVGTGFSLDLETYNKKHPNKKIKISYVKDYHDLQDVSAGKYDFAYTDLSMYNAEQKEYHVNNVKAVQLNTSQNADGQNVGNPYTYFLFGKTAKDKKFQQAVNQELVKLAKDGTLTKISQKYLGQDYSPKVLRNE